MRRLSRVLNERQAALRLDGDEASDAVLTSSGQHAANHRPTVTGGRRDEERVNGRARTVLFRTAVEMDRSRVEAHVPVGRGDVDGTPDKRLGVDGLDDFQISGS